MNDYLYKGSRIILIRSNFPDYTPWGFGITYSAIIKGKETIKRDFYIPLTNAFAAPVDKLSAQRMIKARCEEIIDDDLFNDPNYQEFLYCNGEISQVFAA